MTPFLSHSGRDLSRFHHQWSLYPGNAFQSAQIPSWSRSRPLGAFFAHRSAPEGHAWQPSWTISGLSWAPCGPWILAHPPQQTVVWLSCASLSPTALRCHPGVPTRRQGIHFLACPSLSCHQTGTTYTTSWPALLTRFHCWRQLAVHAMSGWAWDQILSWIWCYSSTPILLALCPIEQQSKHNSNQWKTGRNKAKRAFP